MIWACIRFRWWPRDRRGWWWLRPPLWREIGPWQRMTRWIFWRPISGIRPLTVVGHIHPRVAGTSRCTIWHGGQVLNRHSWILWSHSTRFWSLNKIKNSSTWNYFRVNWGNFTKTHVDAVIIEWILLPPVNSSLLTFSILISRRDQLLRELRFLLSASNRNLLHSNSKNYCKSTK